MARRGGKIGRILRLREGLILEMNITTFPPASQPRTSGRHWNHKNPGSLLNPLRSVLLEPLIIFLKQHIWMAKPGDALSPSCLEHSSDNEATWLQRWQENPYTPWNPKPPEPPKHNLHCLLITPMFQFPEFLRITWHFYFRYKMPTISHQFISF